jgi:sphingomyelin phosphodiesterase 2
MAKLLRAARAKGRMAIALGDFNMIPSSLAHQLLTVHGPAVDTWRVLHPESSVGSTLDESEIARNKPMPSASVNIEENGATCDSVLNTWRWTDLQRKALKRGETVDIPWTTDDPQAKRLDYIFLGGKHEGQWQVTAASVGMIKRHPDLKVSLSDHFSVEVTLSRTPSGDKSHVVSSPSTGQFSNNTVYDEEDYLSLETYDAILAMTETYVLRERSQRRNRIAHFFFSLGITISCLVAVWFVPKNFVSFLLMLLSSLSLTAGTVDGLIGLLFMSWEIRCLKEFRWEMRNQKELSRLEVGALGRGK